MTDNELLLAISNIMDKKIHPLENRLDNIENRLDNIENRLDNVENRLDNVENDIQDLKFQVHKINLRLDNNITGQLREIQACYISTYERYKKGVEKNEQLYSDMELVKDVLKDHSQKLQKIS